MEDGIIAVQEVLLGTGTISGVQIIIIIGQVSHIGYTSEHSRTSYIILSIGILLVYLPAFKAVTLCYFIWLE